MVLARRFLLIVAILTSALLVGSPTAYYYRVLQLLKNDISLPPSFWETVNFRFSYIPPRYDSDEKGWWVRFGETHLASRTGSGMDAIEINMAILDFEVFSPGERWQELRETLAHESAHILRGRYRDSDYRLLNAFASHLMPAPPNLRLGGVVMSFGRDYKDDGGEVFADIGRMLICPPLPPM